MPPKRVSLRWLVESNIGPIDYGYDSEHDLLSDLASDSMVHDGGSPAVGRPLRSQYSPDVRAL